MKLILVSAFAVLLQVPSPAFCQGTFPVAGLGTINYALSVPQGYDDRQSHPLVLALHPGGERTPNYGRAFMQEVVAPALTDLHAVIVAPDCPTQSWSDPETDRAVMALLENVLTRYAIDRRHILVTGFSLGGHGTWFMSSAHADFFTGAIVMAGSPGAVPLERLGLIPTYVIHSRNDQVVPFDPAERTTRELKNRGRVVRFEALQGVSHFQMGGYVASLRRAGDWIAQQWAASSGTRAP